MASIVHIARCPEHGLHGQRAECFVCGGPVEQVAVVTVEQFQGAAEALRALFDATGAVAIEPDIAGIAAARRKAAEILAAAAAVLEAGSTLERVRAAYPPMDELIARAEDGAARVEDGDV